MGCVIILLPFYKLGSDIMTFPPLPILTSAALLLMITFDLNDESVYIYSATGYNSFEPRLTAREPVRPMFLPGRSPDNAFILSIYS